MSAPSAPEVSVVLSAWNAEEHLAATVESILDQLGVELELIAIDDGSNDGTGRVLDRYAADPRVRVVHQENTGLTLALRRGCEMARGLFIARQDAGDLSLPGRLAAQAAALEGDASLAFVSCWTRVTGPELEELWVETGGVAADQPLEILDGTMRWGVVGGPAHHGSVMMRTAAYRQAGGYRGEFRYAQDWDLWYRLASVGRFQTVGRVLYSARIAPEGLSSQSRSAQRELAEIALRAHRARIAGEAERPFLEQAAAVAPRGKRARRSAGLYFVGEALRRRGDVRSRRYFRQAIADTPWSIRSWIRLLQSQLRRGGG